MTIDTTYYDRCIQTLKEAFSILSKTNPEEIQFDIYRSACIKEFEIILEQSGKLLRKILKPYFHTAKQVDELTFKDIFRHATLKNLMSVDACERWLLYRDNRNSTAHDYGIKFAEETLVLLPQFIEDATALSNIITKQNGTTQR